MGKTNYERLSGILLHPTSLPSKYGIGDLGQAAYDFVDFLEQAGQHLWQVLPLTPTGCGNSPYSSCSVFAGQPLLISPDKLAELGLLKEWELETCPAVENEERVDYDTVTEWKNLILKQAFSRFEEDAEYKAFVKKNSGWLTDYALYMACKDKNDGKEWNDWEAPYRQPDRKEKTALKKELAEEMKYYYFVQFIFYKQWAELKAYANEKGIMIIGDMPLFVSLDSADVWAKPKLFQLNSEGQQTVVAGVPPDYFSAVGQRWGNPLYDWKVHKKNNFKWWVARVSHQLELADYVRIDHFRGLEAYWEIPAEEETALNGRWVKAPGKELFETIEKELGDNLPIIAEDLGIITPEVEELRDMFKLPGMKVLQFAFEAEDESTYLPHQLKTPNCVCYSGTHDNNTTQGWYASATETARDKVRVYMNTNGSNIHRDFIRTCFGTIARFAIVPMQDTLGLGEDGRMNVPGVANGNWNWRYKKDALSEGLAKDLAMLTRIYGR